MYVQKQLFGAFFHRKEILWYRAKLSKFSRIIKKKKGFEIESGCNWEVGRVRHVLSTCSVLAFFICSLFQIDFTSIFILFPQR